MIERLREHTIICGYGAGDVIVGAGTSDDISALEDLFASVGAGVPS